MNKALSDLEKVTVRFKRGEFNIELEGTTGRNFLNCWCNIEWVFNKFTCCFIQYLKKSPINSNWKSKLILNSHCFWLRYSATVCKLKIN